MAPVWAELSTEQAARLQSVLCVTQIMHGLSEGPHCVPTWAPRGPRAAVPLHLEDALGHGGDRLVELLLPNIM
jgi:hypothetical protein